MPVVDMYVHACMYICIVELLNNRLEFAIYAMCRHIKVRKLQFNNALSLESHRAIQAYLYLYL